MKPIDEYPGYTYHNGKVQKGEKELTCTVNHGSKSYKLKHISGKWERVSLVRIKAIVGDTLLLPLDAKQIDNTPYYIDRKGNVYSFSSANPAGVKLKHHIDTKGYPAVCLKALNTTKTIHQLLLETFVDRDYVKKGLCCLHKDNDKTNYDMSNLSIGTYSKNNKDAYKDGLNTGNKEYYKQKRTEGL